ncbi:DUF2793 domain-containing protein [Rhodovulum tesquicola]|uniref:DUF2793 domain-containing protein n=1 Tax=Rhodovulum tesquicola TaxID=540254 RepID=UPI0020981176|nr:DUF2793 domain-containing protein [Rhodovulum tesquicola]MCO8146436.1 DUF2793 domain-containing protein [Rhodovulum tesquicola]
MTETANLSLPLLQAAQAQKHVTVNEALVKLDALVQLRLQSLGLAAPPADAHDGQAWGVAAGASGDWAGQAGSIAIADNGGWIFAEPLAGWRAWIVDTDSEMRHDGTRWVPVATSGAVTPTGAAFATRVVEFDHPISAGGAQPTTQMIPSHAMVFAVTARVIDPITGTVQAWSLGSEGAPDRFGSGLGTGLNSYALGVLGQPMTYYGPEPLVLTPLDGTFAGGKVRFAVHYAEFAPPGVV